MTNKNIFIPIALILLGACKNEPAKIIVYANTGAQINKEAKTITATANTGHLENEMEYSAGVEISFSGPSGEKKFEFKEPGYFILNTKASDTIIGGFTKYSLASEAKRNYTLEDIQKNIDSIKNLLAGNTNGTNFFIPPLTSKKITSNPNAVIISPFHQNTSISAEEGKEPEVYRFYSINEVRETLENLEKIGKSEQEAD